jgi:hypothetical protein
MKAVIILSLLFLTACTTTATVQNPRAIWCENNQPIYLPEFAIASMSRADKEKYLAFHLQGESWCGWKP